MSYYLSYRERLGCSCCKMLSSLEYPEHPSGSQVRFYFMLRCLWRWIFVVFNEWQMNNDFSVIKTWTCSYCFSYRSSLYAVVVRYWSNPSITAVARYVYFHVLLFVMANICVLYEMYFIHVWKVIRKQWFFFL